MDTKIKIYTEIIFEAKRRNLPLSGFRLWFLAKHFDRGNGNIPIKDFKHYLRELGISSKNISRWIENATDFHLIEKHDDLFRLASWEIASRISGCTSLKRGALIPIDKLIAKGWIAWVWAGFLLHFRGKPICRNTLFNKSGIPLRTQYEYERKAGIAAVANYADFGSVEDNPLLAIALSVSEGHYTKAGRIRRRLGNSYLPNDVQLANKGRLKQVNTALRIYEGSSQKPVYRLYCEWDEEVKRLLRANRRTEDIRNRPDFIFQFYVQLPKGAVWSAVPC